MQRMKMHAGGDVPLGERPDEFITVNCEAIQVQAQHVEVAPARPPGHIKVKTPRGLFTTLNRPWLELAQTEGTLW